MISLSSFPGRLSWFANGVRNKAKRFGALTTAKIIVYELMYQFRFPARTLQILKVGVSEEGSVESFAQSAYFFLHEAFDRLKIDPGRTVFVDVGCGLGRALLFASQFPFKKLIGVDCSEKCCEAASANLTNYYLKTGKKAPDWQIIEARAETFAIPPEGDMVFYIYEPFNISIMETVAENLVRASRERRGQIRVIYLGLEYKERPFRQRKQFQVLRSTHFSKEDRLTILSLNPSADDHEDTTLQTAAYASK